MRRPSKFPMFWTKESGFDYALYNRLEAEADYFLLHDLHDLHDWIRRTRYLDAVQTVVEVKVLSESEARNHKQLGVNMEVQTHHGSYSGTKRFRNPCPHHIDNRIIRGCHYCEDLISKFEPHYDDAEKKLTVVTTRTVFDESVYVNGMEG
jgi:hypothetical protein